MTSLLLLLGALGMALCQWLIFCYAPVEVSMGLTQKIFYLHLPLAWWGLVSFMIVFVASVAFLWKRKASAMLLAKAAGEVGELLALLTVITGIIWGKTAWGVWWTWDPRLTTALVLCFLYAGWLMLHSLDFPEERKQMLCAVTGILAFLDVPLVFVSSRIWRTIHPAVFTSQGIQMSQEMLITVLCALLAFGFFFGGLVRLRLATLKAQASIKSYQEQNTFSHSA
ncbi:MAG: cytochrome c biogenesis protein CcsA [Desulfovibrio sp.]|nr:cytochrome c biogenesis protein CcsA [Desulfovibrio sp.]